MHYCPVSNLPWLPVMMADVLALRLLSHQVQQLSHQFNYSEKILMDSLGAVMMANVLASLCPLPLVPSSRHLPPFSQQLEDMFISTKGAEHWKCVPTTSQQYVPETSLNYSHYNLSFHEKSGNHYHLIIKNTDGIFKWPWSKHLSSLFDNQ